MIRSAATSCHKHQPGAEDPARCPAYTQGSRSSARTQRLGGFAGPDCRVYGSFAADPQQKAPAPYTQCHHSGHTASSLILGKNCLSSQNALNGGTLGQPTMIRQSQESESEIEVFNIIHQISTTTLNTEIDLPSEQPSGQLLNKLSDHSIAR